MAYLLVANSGAAQAETTPEQVFKIRCDWKHEARLDDQNRPPELATGIAYSASGKPHRIDEGHAMTVEVAGVGGTRHFMMPDVGGALAGMMITIYPDGQSLRVQHYRTQNRISAHATIGTCEVIG
ncbi:hypothetical protein [uncultured Roseobacter sp.]|uniref:hypothetical protein n=1 Tax=uncultured Roseobacter sp. TaxID=114847 RepID=UPI0026058ED4|nr:hypothetical protein [uncultured Roseobacter sp.]